MIEGPFNASIRLLNQPIVKESTKNIVGLATFIFGLIEVYDIYQIANGREVSTEAYLSSSKWVQIANKVTVVCAKISLILNAGVSRPGVFIISFIVGHVFSTVQLNRIFGPNTVFAINPWHPRHVISMAELLLALPSVVQSTYKSINWMYRKICYQAPRIDRQNTHHWLTDSKIQLMNLFNIITSRPTLHIGNQLSRLILYRSEFKN